MKKPRAAIADREALGKALAGVSGSAEPIQSGSQLPVSFAEGFFRLGVKGAQRTLRARAEPVARVEALAGSRAPTNTRSDEKTTLTGGFASFI